MEGKSHSPREEGRKFQLTINNPKEKGYTYEKINEILNEKVDYYCVSTEIGKTGTEHIHIFIYSRSPIRFSTMKNRFPEAHIEKARGSCIDNIKYIKKEGKWEDSEKAETVVEGSFEEHGVLPSEKAEKEPDMVSIIAMIDDGKSINEVINEFPKYALRVNELESLYNLRKANNEEMLRDVKVTYIYGDTGTGKTYSIYKKYKVKDVCRITNYKDRGIFDSYHGQRVLVFDEFHSQIDLPQMLTYLDIYPVSLPARYHDRQAMYTEVYILSNLPLEKQYEIARSTDVKTWKAFERRINIVLKQIGFDQTVEVPKGDEYYDENPFTSR